MDNLVILLIFDLVYHQNHHPMDMYQYVLIFEYFVVDYYEDDYDDYYEIDDDE